MFIHAIDLENTAVCLCIQISGSLISPLHITLSDLNGIGKNYTPVNDLTVDDLKKGNFGESAVTPRVGYVMLQAAILRSGQEIADGYGRLKPYSVEQKEHIIRISDIEIDFEIVRRKEFPNMPSRLSSLYLAENTSLGKQLIREMFSEELTILEVKDIKPLSMAKVNVSWFDKYCSAQNPGFINSYWSGDDYDTNGRWEYLLEGQINFTQASIDFVKTHGYQIDRG